MVKGKKNISLFDKIRYKYRLIIINDETFEQKASVKLSKFNIYIAVGTFVLIMIFFVTSVIAFTNLKYYLPGIGKINFRHQLSDLSFKSDSLVAEIDKRNMWINNFQKIIKGEIGPEFYLTNDTGSNATSINVDEIDLNYIPEEDKKLREEVEHQVALEKINKKIRNENYIDQGGAFSDMNLKVLLQAPIKGVIIKPFSILEEHFGVDIAANENEKIKSIYDGIVILSEWNPKTGNVIAIQHPNNLLSFYKHNASLLKKRGTFVKKGEAIAIIGNSGELSSGPHLHLEIWLNGTIQDPEKYIDLEKLN